MGGESNLVSAIVHILVSSLVLAVHSRNFVYLSFRFQESRFDDQVLSLRPIKAVLC